MYLCDKFKFKQKRRKKRRELVYMPLHQNSLPNNVQELVVLNKNFQKISYLWEGEHPSSHTLRSLVLPPPPLVEKSWLRQWIKTMFLCILFYPSLPYLPFRFFLVLSDCLLMAHNTSPPPPPHPPPFGNWLWRCSCTRHLLSPAIGDMELFCSASAWEN